FPLVLVIVSVISAGSLAGLGALTQKGRKAIEDKETEAALKIVLPSADSFHIREASVDGHKFSYRIAMKGENAVGYVVEGSATGYSSVIKVMVGVDSNFVIQGIKVLAQKETPGLGDKIQELLSKKTWGTVITGSSPDEPGLRPWFQVQFDGKKVPVKVDKDGGDIESITGATISSRAVCEAVNEAVERLKKAVGAKQ
ncbi:MAG: RnfABCDGE type electron transport complex subunit G, partial [Proteobacteria bacterium]|nr:RnfABCDGE type electron transport complex subunit G [Pseudomonadota bacterium]